MHSSDNHRATYRDENFQHSQKEQVKTIGTSEPSTVESRTFTRPRKFSEHENGGSSWLCYPQAATYREKRVQRCNAKGAGHNR